MNRAHKKDVPSVHLVEPAQWHNPKQAAAILGMSVTELSLMRVERRGPRFKKKGETPQSRVLYAASDLAEYQNSLRTVETENYETQKAS